MSTAAAIRYRWTGPSTEDGGVSTRDLETVALDGRVGTAVLRTGKGLTGDLGVGVVMVHGSGENMERAPVGPLSRALAERGFTTLSINTRQHDDGVNTDDIRGTLRDIDAAVWTMRALGCASIVLHGHSLGTAQVQMYAALNWWADIRAVVLTGPFANLPWKSRQLLSSDDDVYRDMSREARAAVVAGRPEQVLAHELSWIYGRSTPVTAGHFASYRDEGVGIADSTHWIRRIPYPILAIRAADDAVVHPFELRWLVSVARSEASLVPDVRAVTLPAAEGCSGHAFEGRETLLAETVAGWLTG
jgi:pimeloyl-ACP methyl ester carboxylesterase